MKVKTWNVSFTEESLNDILNKKKYPSGSKVIVNSMSDIFHEDINYGNLEELFLSMHKRQDLIFQITTKCPDRMLKFFKWHINYIAEPKFVNYLYKDMYKHICFEIIVESQNADEQISALLELRETLNYEKHIVCIDYQAGGNK